MLDRPPTADAEARRWRPGVEQIPSLYDAFMALFERGGLLEWRRHLVALARGRTLEVGCGTGRNLPLYGKPEPIACDPYLAVVLAARRRAPGVRFVVADAQALPFRARSFDSAVSSLVFCSVDSPARGLREIARILEPEGRLLMIEHVRSDSRWLAWLQDRVQPLWTRVAGGCRPNRPTERTVREAGFEIDPASRRARGVMRLLEARPRSEPDG
ncbi:MAG: class I SAM-dependent methyltransferase [Acidobacteriota bacterium]